MKIGILTWHYYKNVGSNLQAFALQKIIKKLGHEPVFINYRYKKFDDSFFKGIIKNSFIQLDKIFPKKLNENLRFGALRFQQEEFKCTKKRYDKNKLKKFIGDFDSVICGSDQIWAPNVYDDVYMLSFVDDLTNKISYAPSIGLNDIPKELISDYKKYIGRFNYISVREEAGVKLLKDKCDIDAKQVLDPTLLLERCDWENVIRNESSIEDRYIFVYFLGEKKWTREWMINFAKSKGLKLVMLSQSKEDNNLVDIYYNSLGPRKFIKMILDAEYILTDSFHGMIFSIIFEKEFFILNRFNSNEILCQNSRIESLTNLLGLSNRRISQNEYYHDKKIDYYLVKNKLEKERQKSIQFLKNAIYRKGE